MASGAHYTVEERGTETGNLGLETWYGTESHEGSLGQVW